MLRSPEITVEIEYDIKETAATVRDTKIVDNSLMDEPAVFSAPFYDRVRRDAYGFNAYDENGYPLRWQTVEEDGVTYLVLEPGDGSDHFEIPSRATKEYTVEYCIPNYLNKSGNIWYFSNHYGHTVKYPGHRDIGRVGKRATYRIPLGRWYWLHDCEVKVAPDKAQTNREGASLVIKYGFTIALNESEYNTVVIVVSKAKWIRALAWVGLVALGWTIEKWLPLAINWLSRLL